MTYRGKLRLICLPVIALLVGVLPLSTVAAATKAGTVTGPGQALEIAPPLIDVRVNPGQTINAQIYIRDISSGPLVVTNQINDFTAKGETGVPQILFNNSAKDPYSLIGYISPLPSLLLKSEQLEKLTIQINIPKNASPGGHFGVIRFTGTPPALNGGSGVSLSASLGALVLLTVNGNIVENLQTSSFSVTPNGGRPSSFFQSDPFYFNEVLKNAGNEQVIPTGIITLKDMFGHTVLQMNINEPQGNILPGTLRKFTEVVNHNDVGSKLFFGAYTASFDVKYGTPIKNLVGTLKFWVIPVNLILIWAVVLIGGFFLLRFAIKRYNQHIISKAQKPKNRKK